MNKMGKKILSLFLIICVLTADGFFSLIYGYIKNIISKILSLFGKGSGGNKNTDLNGTVSLESEKGGLIINNASGLRNYLREQINYIKNQNLSMFDGSENPTRFKLEIPDFNLLNLRPNLDKTVTFYLFDKTNGNKSFDILKIGDKGLLKNSRFNANRPTVFITHGFLGSANGTRTVLVRDAYLMKRDYNVIIVNWSPLSVGSYTVARLMIIVIGNHVGKFINFLYENGMKPKSTILVGHSLGAHIMGIAGRKASSKVYHIIGLDPAWPLFAGVHKSQRISKDDAEHVEIIHCNAHFLGTPIISGHYDFFPNGGTYQNGCIDELAAACSHNRASKYLAEQIKSGGQSFLAVRCDSYEKFNKGECSNNERAIMGALDFKNTAKGIYFLQTNNKEPFGVGL